uniref:AMP-binding domain-containing protein n=1 Tax=Syphacia muris TaxID=451379 RepID=A0A0N5AHV4_9BILA
MKQMVQRINNIGVKNGDIIGTFIGNSVSYLLFTIAAISVGAVVLPLNPSYKMSKYFLNNEIQKYFSQVNIQWILAEQRCAYLFDKQQYVTDVVVLFIYNVLNVNKFYFRN